MANKAQDESVTAKLTINDIARMAGVSKKTVSRVINRSPLLNAQTRERVEAIIRETNYVPNPQARALALGRNFLIGMVYDNPNQQMILSMQRGVLEALHDTEFELIVRPVDRGSARVMDDIRGFIVRQRLYGVIILPPLSENDRLAQLCDNEGCRYVRVGSAVLDDNEHMVVSNDRDAVAEAVRHLIQQGHRRIGLIAGPHGFRSAKERRDGFELALAEAGISLPRSLIADGQYTFESGISASESLFDLSPRPTAIFASNDEMAAGVLYAARLRGIQVPEELSIIGFDDTPVTTRVWPPLSTVRWPIMAMGRAAALKIIGVAIGEGGQVSEPSTFSSTLIRRASVAPPSGG
ncbi:LacI family DNA-binding transcriptional regulator [Sphingomonas sanxanigenens]|uniref:LacI family transcription regulator n=1 Tax=Sphingomonas sanxanigenens DSM 19645 = NX02 TaxID=1123269 RepID=W0ADK3_9SPHN|nr:LacI family DNA-binding transcriptional regulator [Sphingomonas sanxanigenens]AHE53765.1 LacI family transcription regulator [Sphingomonas sanxanigenens DSM 19645 = NX02]